MMHITVIYGMDISKPLLLEKVYSYIAQGRKDTVARWLADGNDIDQKDVAGETLLAYAVQHGYFDVVSLLLASGANVNIQNRQGMSPLHIALTKTENGKLEINRFAIVKILLDYNANADAECKSPFTTSCNRSYLPLELALHAGFREIAKMLVPRTSEIPESALFFAYELGDKYLAMMMLKRGVMFGNLDWQVPVLHTAILNGDSVWVKMLLEYGAPVDEQNCNGETPLQLAAVNWYSEIVHMLLEAGANVNLCDYRKRSPLIYACMLIVPEHLNHEQSTVVSLLLRAGAHVNTGYQGQLSMVLSQVLRQEEFRLLTKEYFANVSECQVTRRVLRHSLELAQSIEYAIATKQDINSFQAALPREPKYMDYYFARNYVCEAAECKGPENLELALRHGGAVEVSSGPLITPLLQAIAYRSYENVRLLVDNGADVNRKLSILGWGPLSCALKGKERAVANYLVTHGAHVEPDKRDEIERLMAHSLCD